MIEIACRVVRAEDVSQRLDRTASDRVSRVLSLHQAEFVLRTDAAPKSGRTLPELLATPGRRCLILIEDVPGELGSLAADPAAVEPPAATGGSWREKPPLI